MMSGFWTRPRLRLAGLVASAALAAASAAAADPAPDPHGILAAQLENASVSIGSLSDRYYVNGLSLGWTSPTDHVPGPLASLDHFVWGEGQQRIGLALTQQIYTPADTALAVPDPNDRPYAGLLLASVSLTTDTDRTRSLIRLDAGLIGPDSGGEALQNGFHDIIHQGHPAGWSHQIQDVFAVDLLAERTWRLPMGGGGSGLETDVLPSLTAAVGDLRDYAQGGLIFRLGQGLDADFGPPRLRPGASGGDAFNPQRDFSWYVFAGGDLQAVGYDLLLQAAPFRSGPHVTPTWDVGEAQFGAVVMARRVRFSFAYVIQSAEFHGQIGGPHQFFSISLAGRL